MYYREMADNLIQYCHVILWRNNTSFMQSGHGQFNIWLVCKIFVYTMVNKVDGLDGRQILRMGYFRMKWYIAVPDTNKCLKVIKLLIHLYVQKLYLQSNHVLRNHGSKLLYMMIWYDTSYSVVGQKIVLKKYIYFFAASLRQYTCIKSNSVRKFPL